MADCCQQIQKELNDLKSQLKEGNNKGDNGDLEKRVARIENYINAFDADLKKITQFVNEIWEHVESILKNLQGFVENLTSWVGSAVKLFGGF